MSITERTLRVFSDVRPGEGATALLLLLNIFLILAAYYFIKPVREGWLAITVIKGLSKIEIKAYSSFGQSLVLLGIIPAYSFLANRLSRPALLTTITLFFASNLLIFWLCRPGYLFDNVPYLGVVFYLWVGIFSVTIVAQFWAFAADLYRDEMGKRLFPVIAVGASAGAVFGSWFTESFVKKAVREPFHLIAWAILPLIISLILSYIADYRGTAKKKTVDDKPPDNIPEANDKAGAFRLIFRHNYLLLIAFLMLAMSWVNTNGENILYGTVQDALEHSCIERGISDPKEISDFIKNGTTAFYGNFYLWINLAGLILQAFIVSRILQFGGVPVILLIMPVVSLISYSMMAVLPLLMIIRMMKITENATNYSINNTARHVLWLPLPSSVVYKAKTAIDTFCVRLGDGMAALTVMVGTQVLSGAIKHLIIFNVVLAVIWGIVAFFVARENRWLTRSVITEKNASETRT